MNPPIRERRHLEAAWRAVNDGRVDTIGSDHAPHPRAAKERPWPATAAGLTGVQTLLPVMLDHVAGRTPDALAPGRPDGGRSGAGLRPAGQGPHRTWLRWRSDAGRSRRAPADRGVVAREPLRLVAVRGDGGHRLAGRHHRARRDRDARRHGAGHAAGNGSRSSRDDRHLREDRDVQHQQRQSQASQPRSPGSRDRGPTSSPCRN